MHSSRRRLRPDRLRRNRRHGACFIPRDRQNPEGAAFVGLDPNRRATRREAAQRPEMQTVRERLNRIPPCPGDWQRASLASPRERPYGELLTRGCGCKPVLAYLNMKWVTRPDDASRRFVGRGPFANLDAQPVGYIEPRRRIDILARRPEDLEPNVRGAIAVRAGLSGAAHRPEIDGERPELEPRKGLEGEAVRDRSPVRIIGPDDAPDCPGGKGGRDLSRQG